MLIFDATGQLAEELSFRQALRDLSVLNQWDGFLFPAGNFLLSLTYSSGASGIVEISFNLPRSDLNGEGKGLP